jgi:hypothetical protein
MGYTPSTAAEKRKLKGDTGMVLSAQSIRKRGIFTPFHERTKAHGMTFGDGEFSQAELGHRA